MKKFLLLALVAYSLNAGVIEPNRAEFDPTKMKNTNHSVWKKAKATQITLYPQTTVVAIDIAADKTQQDKPVKAAVQAVVSSKHIAIKLTWEDATESKTVSTNSYTDGFAVQFPSDLTKPLPYIGMGDPRSPVVVHIRKNGTGYASYDGYKAQLDTQSLNKFEKELDAYQKAAKDAEKSDYFKTFVAKGFRTMTETEGKDTYSFMSYKKGKYEAVIVRPLKDANADLSGATIPVALAVWDGDKAGRDGAKWLSAWLPIVVDSQTANKELIADLVDTPKADIAQGKELAIANCAACHIFDGNDNGMPFMAPNLDNLGGQASVSYIRESMLDPSAVVVPGYNKYAHPSMAWSAGGASTMPPYLHLTTEEQDAIIAYFKSLNQSR